MSIDIYYAKLKERVAELEKQNIALLKDRELLLDALHKIAIPLNKEWVDDEVYKAEQSISQIN